MSCLFDSLSFFISNCDSHQLRSIIVDYLSSNPNMMDNYNFKELLSFQGEEIDRYLNIMSNMNTWGSAFEIKAFVDMFQVRIVVVHDMKSIEFIPRDGEYHLTIYLSYTGDHYEPIKITNETKKKKF